MVSAQYHIDTSLHVYYSYHSLIKCLLIHFVSVSLVLSSPFPWGIHVLFQLIFIHIVGHSKAQAVSHQTLWGPCLIPGQTMWDLVWTKWQWDRFFFMNSNPLNHIIRLCCCIHAWCALRPNIIKPTMPIHVLDAEDAF